MQIDLSINPAKTTESITKFIKQTLEKTGFSRLVVGLSGGIDSSVSLSLAVRALGTSNVHVCLFPYGELNKEGMNDAKLMIKKFDIPSSNIHLIDIKDMVDCITDTVILSPPKVGEGSRGNTLNPSGFFATTQNDIRCARLTSNGSNLRLRKGNIIVRLRMILLYDLAKKYKALVLGTENKTEYLLGYFTRFGDSASDIESIRHLYKTQVRQLAEYLGIPHEIISKIPTAGMWKEQTDEGELGFTYRKADQILHLYVDLKESREEIVKSGFRKEVVAKVLKRLTDNEFKHKTPYRISV